jgi:hypothetical protein
LKILNSLRQIANNSIASSLKQFATFRFAIFDGLVKSQKIPFPVIPAKAGIQCFQAVADHLDSGFHRSTIWTPVFTGVTTFYEFIIFESLTK